MNRKRYEQPKMSAGEILFRIFFGFLIPFVAINGIILFLFIQTPKIHVVDSESTDYEDSKIKFYTESLLPIIDIKTFFQENPIAYSKFGDYYIIDAKDNGTYQIIVTSLNKATVNSYVDIEAHDNDAPTINVDDAVIIGNTLTITVSDPLSGINYDNVYAIDENNNTESPKYIDKASGTIQFQFDSKKKLTIHVEDVNGNASEATFNASSD